MPMWCRRPRTPQWQVWPNATACRAENRRFKSGPWLGPLILQFNRLRSLHRVKAKAAAGVIGISPTFSYSGPFFCATYQYIYELPVLGVETDEVVYATDSEPIEEERTENVPALSILQIL